MSTAIEFNHVSKQYRLGLVSTRTLGADLNRWWTMNIRGKEDPYLKIGSVNDRSTKSDSDFVWALRDIDFKVEQGDVVGIIGKNGAGKSTLLKLLSKVTGPTTGSIKARGRIGSLLEVGTGFHPEMTGRENIFMNGAILGMTNQEIAGKLDEIVDFSGCERYLDTPVKRYSSGMTVRLGFAVAAFLEPEILIVDEVLAVGDLEFQKKAIGKMKEVSLGGERTVLFVSHNMSSVSSLCDSCVLLEKGQISYSGQTNDVINRYYSTSIRSEDINFDLARDVEYFSKGIKVSKILLNGSSPKPLIISSQKGDFILSVEISFELFEKCDIYLVASIFDGVDMIASYSSKSGAGTVYRLSKGEHTIHEEIALPNQIVNGDYYLTIRLNDTNGPFLLAMNRLARITKEGFISQYSGASFTKSNSGYFAITK